jgi:uncharacterized protein YbjT (DUF2867 family)
VRILVVGATGAQGGGVARHLLGRGQFTVRALTRDPDSPAACQLRRRGAEVVEGTLTNRAAIRAALKDCYGVFGVTSYSEHLEGEDVLGMNLVNAVAGSAIEHFVLSALPDIDLLTGGVRRSRQCQIKARFESYARSLQLPATYLHPAPYFESLPAILARRATQAQENCQDRSLPPDPHHGPRFEPSRRAGLPAIAAEDIGAIVAAVFERPEPLFDRTIAAVGDLRPLDHYAALLQSASLSSDGRGASRAVEARPLNTAAVLEDLMPLVDFLTDRDLNRDQLDEGRALHPEMQRFDSWLGLAGRRQHDDEESRTAADRTSTSSGRA